MSVFGFFKGHGPFKQTICILLHNCGMLNLTRVYFVDANVLSNTYRLLRYDMYFRCRLIKLSFIRTIRVCGNLFFILLSINMPKEATMQSWYTLVNDELKSFLCKKISCTQACVKILCFPM